MEMSTVIGHRGASKIAPENTLEGIQAAYDAGLTWVEVDVMLLGDGNLVIHHDRTLDRTTDRTGELFSLTLEEIKKADAGVVLIPSHGDQFKGAQIPTLKEMLDKVYQLGMGVNLEIKMHKHPPAKLVLPLLETLKEHPLVTDKHEKRRLLLSSFDHDVLVLCHHHLPEIALGHLLRSLPDDWLAQAREVNAVTIHVSQRVLTKAMVVEVTERGYELYSYTVNSGKRAVELLSWGVSGVFTDDPAKINKALFY